MKFPDSEFWTYSLNSYQIPEIEQACLRMQDKFQADVNILLYCCWVGQQKIQLTESDIKKLIVISHPWQSNILVHLRAARHTLKTSPVIIPDEQREQTRQQISEMELNAEHMAQLALEKAINLRKKSRNKTLTAMECITNNLTLYCLQLDNLSSSESRPAEINTLIEKTDPDIDNHQQALLTNSL